MPFSKKYLLFLTPGFLGGVFVLLATGAIANPVPDREKSAHLSFPAPETTCGSFTPLTNTIAPTLAEKKLTSDDLPDSACAKDLTEIDQPLVQATPTPEETPTEIPAETPPPVTQSQGWQLYFQPYVTIPVSTYGKVTVRGKSVNYSLGLGQLLEVLQVAVSARAEAWNGNFGLIVDGYYASLQGTGIKAARRPRVEASLQSTLTFTQGIYDFAASYHIGDRSIPYNPDEPSTASFPRVWFAPYVGTRLNALSSTIENTLTFPRVGRVRQSSSSLGRTWFEPLVGGKLGIQLSEPVTLWVRGDASGFGLAGETDMSWNAIFGVDWWVQRQISLQLAYRFYEINYGNGTGDNAFRFQENFNGPYLSATFRF